MYRSHPAIKVGMKGQVGNHLPQIARLNVPQGYIISNIIKKGAKNNPKIKKEFQKISFHLYGPGHKDLKKG